MVEIIEDRNRLNILLIVCDAMRAKNMSVYGYHKKTTPYIEELGEEGIVFNDAYSCFNLTDPSFTSIMTGKYPISHGIIHHGKIPKEELKEYYRRGNRNLAEILKSNGYITLALSWLERWHKDGFDYYEYYGGAKATYFKRIVKNFLNNLPKRFQDSVSQIIMRTIHSSKMLDAQTITNHAIKVINKNISKEKPFFLLVHYMDTHFPYNSPKGYEKKFLEETPNNERIEDVLRKIKNPRWRNFLEKYLYNAKTTDEVVAKYDGAISYIDENIGRLVKFLERKNIKENTIIVLTADHGESLTEHGVYFSHHCLYDELIHVPLIIYYPDLAKGKRVSGFVQHVDIVPTLLDILGIRENFDFDGKTLVPLIKGEVKRVRFAIFAEESVAHRKRAIRTERWKYICSVEGETVSGFETKEILKMSNEVCRLCGFVHAQREELYDLKKDPNETSNIIEKRSEVAQKMRDTLRMWEVYMKTKVEKEKIKRKVRKFQQKI